MDSIIFFVYRKKRDFEMPVGDFFKPTKTKDAKFYCEFCRLWIPNNTIQRQRHESDDRHLRNKKRHIESVIKKQAAAASSSSSSVVDNATDSKVQPTSTAATLNKKKNQELVFASNSAAKRKTATNQQVEEIIGLGQAPLQSFDSVSLILNKVVTEGVGSVAAAGQWVQSTKEFKEVKEEQEEVKEESATEQSDDVKVGQSVRKNLINAYEDDQEDRRVKLKGIIEGPGQVVDSTDGTPTITSTAFKKRKIVKANIKKK
jgi:Pyruvate/2-oxoacid:ferredoxin oxidoreductase delta subunit